MAWFPTPQPPQSRQPRGAAPVGLLADLPVLEQGAVLLMRYWCSDDDGRAAVAHDFAQSLGAARGMAAVAAIDHLATLLVSRGRRPFLRHHLGCTCIGGDESAFALMVSAATDGDMEDAMAFALTMLPAAAAYEAIQIARGFGLFVLALVRNRQGHSIYPTAPCPRH